MRSVLIFISVLIILCHVVPVQAQDLKDIASQQPQYSAGPDLSRTIRDLAKFKLERDLRWNLKKSEEEEEKLSQPADDEKPQAPVASVFLKEVEFTESGVLSPEELQNFAAEYKNKDVSISELYNLVNKINQWYRDRGYITALAVLPPQKIIDGKLKIVLVEGKVGRTLIQGNVTTGSEYINQRIRLPEGRLVSLKTLNKDLVWFNGTNDIKVKTRLQAGIEPGTTDYLLEILEPKETVCSIFMDTAGSASTGRTRSGISYTSNSFSGVRDSLNMTTMLSKTSRAGFINYTRPINRKGHKLSLYTTMNQLNVFQKDLNGFNIKGESRATGLTLTLPQVVRSRYREELIFDVQKQTSLNKVLGMIFVDDDENRYSIGKSFMKMTPGEVLYCRPMFTYCHYEGLAGGKHDRKLVVDGVWQKARIRGQLLNLKFTWQITDDDFLPSSDQFYLGGLYSVRGYDESILGGDGGLNSKLDYYFPIKDFRSTQGNLFYDWGRIMGKSLLTTRMIHSVGFGFRHTFVNDSSVSITVGYPFVRKIGDEKIASNKVDLSVNFVF